VCACDPPRVRGRRVCRGSAHELAKQSVTAFHSFIISSIHFINKIIKLYVRPSGTYKYYAYTCTMVSHTCAVPYTCVHTTFMDGRPIVASQGSARAAAVGLVSRRVGTCGALAAVATKATQRACVAVNVSGESNVQCNGTYQRTYSSATMASWLTLAARPPHNPYRPLRSTQFTPRPTVTRRRPVLRAAA
jgi:hypothetical protein